MALPRTGWRELGAAAAAAGADPILRRRVTVALARGAVLGGAFGLAAAAAGSGLAAHFARSVVTPPRDRPDNVRILAVSETTVVLEADEETTAPGRYGVWLAGGSGHARLGDVVARDVEAGTVTRELLGVDAGELVPGPGRWNGWFYTGDPTSALGLDHQEVAIASEVGDLPAWQVPAAARGDRGEDRGVWAVLVHGRGATRAECLRALPLFHRLGLPSLVSAYRNDVEAPASADGRYALGHAEWRDVESAVLHALDAGAREVVLVGWSMGGAIALQYLSRSWTADRVRAVVLDGPVVDWRSVLDHHARANRLPLPVGRYGSALLASPLARALVGVLEPVDLRRSDWVTRAEELQVPLLLVHSEDDEYVPVEPSRRLAEARPDLVRHVSVPGARHCKEWNVDSDRWEREVARFLLDHL